MRRPICLRGIQSGQQTLAALGQGSSTEKNIPKVEILGSRPSNPDSRLDHESAADEIPRSAGAQSVVKS